MTEKAKPEVWTEERCFIAELVNSPAWPEFSLARCRVEPGVTTQLHALSVHEVYVIREGAGLMYLGDQPPFEVRPGDRLRKGDVIAVVETQKGAIEVEVFHDGAAQRAQFRSRHQDG